MTGTDETQLGDDFSYIIRIADTDVDGLRKISVGLCSIKGIGMRTAEMICRLSGVDGSKLGGHLSDEEQDKLRDSIGTYATEMPWWLMKSLSCGWPLPWWAASDYALLNSLH